MRPHRLQTLTSRATTALAVFCLAGCRSTSINRGLPPASQPPRLWRPSSGSAWHRQPPTPEEAQDQLRALARAVRGGEVFSIDGFWEPFHTEHYAALSAEALQRHSRSQRINGNRLAAIRENLAQALEASEVSERNRYHIDADFGLVFFDFEDRRLGWIVFGGFPATNVDINGDLYQLKGPLRAKALAWAIPDMDGSWRMNPEHYSAEELQALRSRESKLTTRPAPGTKGTKR
jgi:hypothetical protein